MHVCVCITVADCQSMSYLSIYLSKYLSSFFFLSLLYAKNFPSVEEPPHVVVFVLPPRAFSMCVVCEGVIRSHPRAWLERSWGRTPVSGFYQVADTACGCIILANSDHTKLRVFTPTIETFRLWFPRLYHTEAYLALENSLGGLADAFWPFKPSQRREYE